MYCSHRFSDDLDLFVNADADFERHADLVIAAFLRAASKGEFSFHIDDVRRFAGMNQVFVNAKPADEGPPLKIDLVNDVESHFGDFLVQPPFGNVDSLRNIVSNKLAALFRFEGKDVSDIWAIARSRRISWLQLMEEARKKDAGVDPEPVASILGSVPTDALDAVKWAAAVDIRSIQEDLKRIAEDIFYGRDNSLAALGAPGL